MANYVKFKQGLKKDFNTTNQPLTNGMIYFVIDENNHGSIYYDTIVDGKKATKNGTVHRVKFSGLPIKITGSVIGTGVISQDGETIEINTSTNHSHGLAHQDFTVTLSNDDTNLKWTRLGNQNGGGFWLKSIRGQTKAPAWFLPDFSAGIAFGGADTKGIISVRYSQPGVRFAGGNGDAPVWYFTITGANDKTYDLSKIGGHSSDSAKLDHNVTFKIASTADATKGGSGTATNLSGSAVDLYLPTKISGFDLLQATRFQGNADTSTVAAKLGRGGNTSLPMTFNWNGQGGQPTWLWGGENGTDMYVYNPSNFRVAHSVNTAGLDHNITFKISKVADATTGETGITTKLTENAITFTIPSDLSGFNNIQSTRFQGTADNADTVDYFHVAEEKYKYETTKTQPTSGADWCIKISTPDWNGTSETIYLIAEGNNTHGTVILKTGSRQNNWWGYATNYNGTGIIGVYKLVTNSDDVYIKVGGAYTSVRIRTTFNPTISIPATIPDYKFTSVPYQGGFFSNAIYTDNLTFTTPKYWANVPISDNSKTDTQPTFNTAYVSNWWRSTGNTGWWNETHRGGVTMEDDTYVKVAGNKSFLIPSGSLKIGGNGNILFATGNDDATLKVYGQTNTDFGTETIAIQTCFDNRDPQTSEYTTQYANRCNLLLQPRGGQVYIGKNLTTIGDTGYKLFVDGNQWTSGSQWVNGSLFFTDITGNTTDTGTSLKGVYGQIGGNDGWRIAGGARAENAGYLEIATCDDANDPIYVRQYGDGGNWNGYVSLARTFTLLDAAGRSRAPELFEAKKVHVNSLSNQSVAIADIGYQFQVTGTSNFTDSVNISGVTTHHNNIQIDANYSIAKPGKSSAWYGSHTNAMIRMTSINGWSPLLAQKATDGYWVLGHYHDSDFKNQWLFGYLADSNLEGTTGASNSLTTTYRLLNIGGNDNQRMFVSAKYNAAVGSGTQPVYIQNNGNVVTCSYSLNATIEAGTANRMAYYKATNQIGSSGHYVTSSQVGINSNTTYDFTFYVGGNSYFSNLVTVYAGNNLGVKIGNTNITAIDGSLILQNNTALRFGSSEWDWNKWAGLKYVPSSKTIVMGLADSTNFTANSVQSGGTFLFTGMSSIDLNKTASIKNLAVGGGIYWNPYVESAGDGSDAASITVIAGGVAGGTELRIQQQNDAKDVINLVVNNSIFLNSKRAFTLYDDWLRINEDSSFGGGIYTGSSLIRSDNQLQVGNNGANFYANSSGNGYFSNTLGIAGTNNNYRLYVKGNQGITAITNRTMTLDTANSNKIGTTIGDLHIQPVSVGSGSAITNGNVSSITFGCDNVAYAGIYSPTSGSYGNHLIFATTGSYANGAYGRMIITAGGNVGIGTMSPSYKLHVLGDIYANGGWLRTSGAAGWYNETYGGGWYMTDSNFIRNYNSKAVSININSNNAWGIGGHRLATVFKGNDHVSILLSTNTLGYGLCVNNDGHWYWGKRTTNSETSTSGDSYVLYGSTNYISPYSTNVMDLGLSNRRWRSGHIYRDFNIYGNESTGDESHIRFNASDNTQRAIITFNGNVDNTFKSSTHLKIATSYGDIRLAPANGNVNIGDGNCSLTWRKADNGGVTGGLESGIYYSTPGRESVVFANMYAHTGWIFVNGIRPSNKTNWTSLGVTPAVQIHHNALYINRPVRDADTADYNLYVNGSGYINGRLDACNRSNSASYMESAIQIRERGFGGTQDDTWATAPRLSWHWSGRVQAQIGLGSNGWLYMSRDGSFGDACRLVTERTDFTWNISAHMLDGYHESSFLRRSGGWPDGSGQNINDALGMVFAYSSHGLPGSWGVVTTFDAYKDSSYHHQIYGDGWNNEMYFRTCSADRGGWNAWRHLLDDVNYRGILDGSYVLKTGTAPSDLNSATTSGFYRVNSGHSNSPNSWGQLIVCHGGGDTITQIYGDYGSGTLYTRSGNPSDVGGSGSWNGWYRLWKEGDAVTGAVWNDYAECRQSDCSEPGRVVFEKGDDTLTKTEKRLQHFAGVISDTWGFSQGETDKAKTNIAVAGRVLVYTYQDRNNYKPGNCVCAAPNGTIDIMTREEIIKFPDRIVGIVSCVPDYEEWGGGKNADRDPVKVNGRIWIKVK